MQTNSETPFIQRMRDSFQVAIGQHPIINENVNQYDPMRTCHNYAVFLDRKNRVLTKIPENNGFTIFEALLLDAMGKPVSDELHKTVLSFRAHNDIFGWWPVYYMQRSKEYFLGKKLIEMYPNIDDTMGGHKYLKIKVTDELTKEFLSDTEIQTDFRPICLELNIDKEDVLRLWGQCPWNYEVDIIGIADFISYMDLNSPFQKQIFDINEKLVNHIIENYDFTRYFRYEEPKITGVWLFFFFDKEYNSFLSKKAKSKLMDQLKHDYKSLKDAKLGARWGGDNGGILYFHGVNILLQNEKIPPLMYEYTLKHFL